MQQLATFLLILLSGLGISLSEEISLQQEIVGYSSFDGEFYISLQIQAGALATEGNLVKVVAPQLYIVITTKDKSARWDHPVGLRQRHGTKIRTKVSESLNIVTVDPKFVILQVDNRKVSLARSKYEEIEKAVLSNEKRIVAITSKWQDLAETWTDESPKIGGKN
jgi:hypothetical protein